ncbi:MAG: Uma2 family endonuclease [Planctomycetes bacterium]|nr:Uma2 family endonuclease [Planctomycetota bacterium]
MGTTRSHAAPAPNRRRDRYECDEHGRELYPGDVEDAMPEGNWPRWQANYLFDTLHRFVVIPEHDSAYANLPIYHERGTSKHVSPDVFFAPGVPYEVRRRSYCLWESGITPQVVFEILSRGSEVKDRVANRRLYEALGIAEYYWFEPDTCRLEALELDPATGLYRERTADAEGRFFSAGLSLHVGVERDRIGLYRGGRYLPPPAELLAEAQALRAAAEEARADAEEARAEAERARALEAAARAEAERARALEAAARAEAERSRDLEAAARAEAERARAAAEVELRSLREELERLRPSGRGTPGDAGADPSSPPFR